jgi:hypothetical protein
MNQKSISTLAATVSGNLTELHDNLADGDPLRDGLSRLSADLDKRFNLHTITCAVEPL